MNRSTVAMLLILTGAVGCGGSSAGPAMGDAGPEAPSADAGQPAGGLAKDQFLLAYKHARCSYLARCGFMRSLDACLASTTFNPYSGYRYLLAAIDRGVVTYDPASAEACVAAVAAQVCSDTTPTGGLPCSQIFHGTIPPGATCLSAEERAPAATGTALCVGQSTSCGSGCCSGICGSVETAAAGGSCAPGANGVFLRCPQGQYCHLQMRTCMPLAALGDACDRVGSMACQSGLFCSRDAMSGATRCFQPGPTGGSCNHVNFPSSGVPSCVSLSDVCTPTPNPAVSTCTPRVPVGGACAGGVPCTWTAYCDFSQVCRAFIGLGEACPAGQAGVCEGELGCVEASDGTATCVPPPDSGICPPPV